MGNFIFTASLKMKHKECRPENMREKQVTCTFNVDNVTGAKYIRPGCRLIF